MEDTPKDQVVEGVEINVGAIIVTHRILLLSILPTALRKDPHVTRAENWDILNKHVEESDGILTNGEDEDELV